MDAFRETHGHSAVLVSVTQADSGANCPTLPNGKCYCTTAEEQRAIDEEGSPSGPLLRAVNAVAAAVAESHPQAVIETLAYSYTLQPPRLVRPRSNVNIVFCAAENDDIKDTNALPLTHPANAQMLTALKKWSALMPRDGRGALKIWAYTANFDNDVMPVPNWLAVGQNIQIYAQNRASGCKSAASLCALVSSISICLPLD